MHTPPPYQRISPPTYFPTTPGVEASHQKGLSFWGGTTPACSPWTVDALHSQPFIPVIPAWHTHHRRGHIESALSKLMSIRDIPGINPDLQEIGYASDHVPILSDFKVGRNRYRVGSWNALSPCFDAQSCKTSPAFSNNHAQTRETLPQFNARETHQRHALLFTLKKLKVDFFTLQEPALFCKVVENKHAPEYPYCLPYLNPDTTAQFAKEGYAIATSLGAGKNLVTLYRNQFQLDAIQGLNFLGAQNVEAFACTFQTTDSPIQIINMHLSYTPPGHLTKSGIPQPDIYDANLSRFFATQPIPSIGCGDTNHSGDGQLTSGTACAFPTAVDSCINEKKLLFSTQYPNGIMNPDMFFFSPGRSDIAIEKIELPGLGFDIDAHGNVQLTTQTPPTTKTKHATLWKKPYPAPENPPPISYLGHRRNLHLTPPLA